MNTRRKFILALGAGAFSSPLISFAQQSPPKVPRLGLLMAGAAAGNKVQIEALRRGLRELGYLDGNIVLEYRSSEGNYARLPELAAELVRVKVEIIVKIIEIVVDAVIIVYEASGDFRRRRDALLE